MRRGFATAASRRSCFRPMSFLQLAEPKLYDFTRYNSCMITGKIDGTAISPAAQ